MNDILVNCISALAVSVIITAMAKVQSQKLKAILYTLPFPITIALIGSNSIATSLSISGLVITLGFLWGCYFLHHKLGTNIIVTDVLLSVLYVVIGYTLARTLKISFWAMISIYVLIWVGLMALFGNMSFSYKKKSPTMTNPWVKAVTVFVIAFGLFSAHQYLAAFVVTFPYNGVFAVYENRYGLLPQAALFTRNSVALAAFFTANYLVGTQLPATMRYIASWTAFGIALILVNKLIEVRVKST